MVVVAFYSNGDFIFCVCVCWTLQTVSLCKAYIWVMCWALWMRKLKCFCRGSRTVEDSLFKTCNVPDQNIILHASPVARNSAIPISAFSVQLTSFSPVLFNHKVPHVSWQRFRLLIPQIVLLFFLLMWLQWLNER